MGENNIIGGKKMALAWQRINWQWTPEGDVSFFAEWEQDTASADYGRITRLRCDNNTTKTARIQIYAGTVISGTPEFIADVPAGQDVTQNIPAGRNYNIETYACNIFLF